MTTRPKETRDEIELRRAAAYERGWVDSLRAFQACQSQPVLDRYDYMAGWWACAKYRWSDLTNNGVAPDPTWRSSNPIRWLVRPEQIHNSGAA